MSDILRLKCTKFDFGAGGAYSAPPDPIAGFKGPTSKRRGGEGRGGERRGEKGRGEGREGRERGREGPHQLGGPRAPKHVKTALRFTSIAYVSCKCSPKCIIQVSCTYGFIHQAADTLISSSRADLKSCTPTCP